MDGEFDEQYDLGKSAFPRELLERGSPPSFAKPYAQFQGSPEEVLREMLDLMQKVERRQRGDNLDIINYIGVCDYQLLATFPVPFMYNSIALTVIGGVVAVTCDALLPVGKDAIFTTIDIVSPGTQLNYGYGSAGVTVGDTAGSTNLVPQVFFNGPQELRFHPRPAGNISLWVHPFSRLNSRHAINPTEDTLIVCGQVQFIPE